MPNIDEVLDVLESSELVAPVAIANTTPVTELEVERALELDAKLEFEEIIAIDIDDLLVVLKSDVNVDTKLELREEVTVNITELLVD